jgi:hypothetical protein
VTAAFVDTCLPLSDDNNSYAAVLEFCGIDLTSPAESTTLADDVTFPDVAKEFAVITQRDIVLPKLNPDVFDVGYMPEVLDTVPVVVNDEALTDVALTVVA